MVTPEELQALGAKRDLERGFRRQHKTFVHHNHQIGAIVRRRQAFRVDPPTGANHMMSIALSAKLTL